MAACPDVVNEGADQIHLMLSTPGGYVADGIAIYNFLRAIVIEVIVYNIGTVDSIRNVVIQAGNYRIASPSSRFMFHGVGFDMRQARLEFKDLRKRTQGIENDQSMTEKILALHTTIGKEELKAPFLDAAFIPSVDAEKRGIVDEVREVSLPKGIPLFQLAFQG